MYISITMPNGSQIGLYRGSARGRFTARQIANYAKQALQMKKEYDKAKAKSRKPRSDKGRKRGARAPKKPPYTPAKGISKLRTLRGSKSSIRPRELSNTFRDNQRFPQRLHQKYYLTGIQSYVALDPGIDGTIVNPTMLYSKPSSEYSTSSIVILNVANTESHWIPRRNVAERVYRTGNQLTGEVNGAVGTPADTNDSFLWYNNPTNTTLISDKCPMFQNGLAENAVGAVNISSGESHRGYTIPNSVLTGCEINLQVGNPLVQDILLSVKLIRRSDNITIAPSTFGTDATAITQNINTICNARTWTDPNHYSPIWSTTVRLPALKTGSKIKLVNIRKTISMNYRRSQYRKQYNADNMANIGTQAQPSYTLSDDNSMYNSCYIVISACLTSETYIADVQAGSGQGGTGDLPTERVPQIAEYPPLSVGGSGRYTTIPEGCMFKFGGSVSVYHRVEAIRRAIGGAVADEVESLQKQITELTLAHQKQDKGSKNEKV